MLGAGGRLRDGGEPFPGEGDERRDGLLELTAAAVGAGVDGRRLAEVGQVPAGEVEVMDRLFEDPASDAGRVVAPAVRAAAEAAPPEVDRARQRAANPAGRDLGLEPPPERRKPQLVADGDCAATATAGLDDGVAVGQRRRQRLFDQDVPPGLERRQGDLGVEDVRGDDVDDVELQVGAGEHRLPTDDRRHAQLGLGAAGRLGRRDGDRGQLGARRVTDRVGMAGAPASTPDQAEAGGHPLRAPLVRPRTT